MNRKCLKAGILVTAICAAVVATAGIAATRQPAATTHPAVQMNVQATAPAPLELIRIPSVGLFNPPMRRGWPLATSLEGRARHGGHLGGREACSAVENSSAGSERGSAGSTPWNQQLQNHPGHAAAESDRQTHS